MTIWAIVLLVALGTYAMRASFLLVVGRFGIPPKLERGLRYIAPAVMAAIVAPAVVSADGALAFDARVVAAVVGALVAWRWRSVPLTLVAGLGTFYAVSLL